MASCFSTLILVPARTALNAKGSLFNQPNTVTGLDGRISSPLLAGVLPKKMQKARPGSRFCGIHRGQEKEDSRLRDVARLMKELTE